MTYNELKEEISCAIREITSPVMPKKGRERLAANWIAKAQAIQDEETEDLLECLQEYASRAKEALDAMDSEKFHQYFGKLRIEINDTLDFIREEK